MKSLFALLTGAVLLSACGSGGGNSTSSLRIPDTFQPEALLRDSNQLASILTKEMVAEIAGIDSGKIGMRLENDISRGGPYTLQYSWPTGKTHTVGGKHTIATYHSLGIGFVSPMDEAAFSRRYGSAAGVQEAVDALASAPYFNQEAALAEGQYLAAYAQRRKPQKLDGVGTLAYWETPVNALHVLANGAAFTITTNFGDDEKEAREKAIALAGAVVRTY